MFLSKKKLAPSFGAYESVFKSKYFIVFALFLVWITFFDKHSLVTHYQLEQKLEDLEKENVDYEQKILDTKAEIAELNKDLEKFAREKYYFQKADEDVFVVVKK